VKSVTRLSVNKIAKVTDHEDPRVVHLCYGFEESNCTTLTDHEARGRIMVLLG
jgi:hypothetical protein